MWLLFVANPSLSFSHEQAPSEQVRLPLFKWSALNHLRQDFLEYLFLLGSSVQGRRVVPAILRSWDRKKKETVSTSEEGRDASWSSGWLLSVAET